MNKSQEFLIRHNCDRKNTTLLNPQFEAKVDELQKDFMEFCKSVQIKNPTMSKGKIMEQGFIYMESKYLPRQMSELRHLKNRYYYRLDQKYLDLNKSGD